MLARAESLAGSEAVQSATLATRAELSLEFETLNLMGVEIPRIERKHVARSALGRGYSITATSISIDEAAALRMKSRRYFSLPRVSYVWLA
jgi:vacuolar-type H+-ATPase subunit D/Vma8